MNGSNGPLAAEFSVGALFDSSETQQRWGFQVKALRGLGMPIALF
jgi:hypothetical protein